MRGGRKYAIFGCGWTRCHWEASGFGDLIDVAPSDSGAHRIKWVLKQLGEEERGRFLAMAWAIWSIRNQRLFDDSPLPAEVVCSGYVKLVADYQCYAERVLLRPRVMTDVGCSSWSPPAAGIIKINVDAHMAGGGVVGLGVVARDMTGKVLWIGCRRVVAEWDVDVAEAQAACFGLRVAYGFGLSNISLESDALNLVMAVKKDDVARTPYGLCIDDLRSYLNLFSQSSFNHVRRGGNTVAHCIARLIGFDGDEMIIVTNFPQVVLTLADIDLI